MNRIKKIVFAALAAAALTGAAGAAHLDRPVQGSRSVSAGIRSSSAIGSASVNIDGTLYWVQLFAD